MLLRSGIPTVAQLDALKATELYAKHTCFNSEFLHLHGEALEKYGKHWGADPFKLWSRRWEYPYVAQRLIHFAREQRGVGPSGECRILDGGSGVTYFPYYICDEVAQARFTCVDYDPSYTPMFEAVNRLRQQERPGAVHWNQRVRFIQASLQSLPVESGSLDAVCCISVLEHTDNYEQIVDEFHRVLRPEGLFVLTFDLSLDGKFTLPRPQAEVLIRSIQRHFTIDDEGGELDLLRDLDRMLEPGILSSDHVRDTEPELLPWTLPVRAVKAVQDLVGGKGWTGGFRSRTIVCCTARKR